MDTLQVLAEKRQILAAATFRFASQLQGLREHAIDQILVKLLYDVWNQGYTGLEEILEIYRTVTRGGYLSPDAALDALDRLADRGEIEPCNDHDGYRLSQSKKEYFQRAEEELDSQLTQLLCRLFNCTEIAAKRFEQPFITVITRVAAQLGDESASQLVNGGSILPSNPMLIDSAVQEVAGHYQGFNIEYFRQGVSEFFRSSDPACNRLLWQLAESYFVTRLIGIDPSGRALSQELFQETEYILDTNTILAAFLESDDNHEVVCTVLTAVQRLGIPVFVADITLEELNSVLDHQYGYLQRIVERGESRWLGRLDSPFLREYDSASPTSPANFFSRFDKIEEALARKWGAKVIHATSSRPTSKINEFAQRLQAKYQSNSSSERTKSRRVALHDAGIIAHIIDERLTTGRNLWLLTLDGSLPGSVLEDSEWASVAIAPRNVIQWIAPVVAQTSGTDTFSRVFAEMVHARFLPRSQFFSTSDFVMLLDVDDNLCQVPDEDIESILSRLRADATNLDTRRAEDREKLTAIVSATLSDKNARIHQRIEEVRADSKQLIDQLNVELNQSKAEMQRRLCELKRNSDSELQSERQARAEAENDRLRMQGYVRFWAAIVASLVIGSVLAWTAVPILISVFDRWPSSWVWPSVTLTSWGSIILLVQQLALRGIVGENRVLVMPRPYQAIMGD